MRVYSVISCEARNCQRLLNKFLEREIPVGKVKIGEDILRFCVEDRYVAKCVEIIENTGVKYAVESRGGAHLVKKLTLRYLSLAVTAVLVIAALMMMNRVCFGVEIVCENSGITSQIKDILGENSVKAFALKERIDTKALSLRICKEIDEVGFANCYFDGGKLKIEVKEVYVEPEDVEYSRIVASRDCIIARVLVYSGTALVKAGDVVRAGDTLIEGYIDTAPDSEDNERLSVPADGLVYAETAYVKSITLCDKVVVSERTGESYKETQLQVFGKTVGKQKPVEYAEYQYTEEKTAFGSVIPITAVTRTYYRTQSAEITLTDAQIDEQISLACIELWREIPVDAKLLNNYTYKKKVDNLHIIDIYYIVEETVGIGDGRY